MAPTKEEWRRAESAFEGQAESRVLSPVDIACIGASSGGFLAFSGKTKPSNEEQDEINVFSKLIESGRTVRVVDASDGFGGAMGEYAILGNTICNDHIANVDDLIQDELMADSTARDFALHRLVSPRLDLVGEVFEALGRIMVRHLGAQIDCRLQTRVSAVVRRGPYQFTVLGEDAEGPFRFETRALYLATGARSFWPSRLEKLRASSEVVAPLEAVTPKGLRRIRELGAGDPENGIHIVGCKHTAMALISTLCLDDLRDVRFTPDRYYQESFLEEIVDQLRGFTDNVSRITVWARDAKPKRVVLRVVADDADEDDAVWKLAEQKRYTGSIYRSRFKPEGCRIYNSHNALESPHAECMLAIRDQESSPNLPNLRYRILSAEKELPEDLKNAAVVVNATGLVPRLIPLFDSGGSRLCFASPLRIAQHRRRAVLEDGSTVEGLYLNGVCGQLTADGVVDSKGGNPFLKGDGEDLPSSLALGVLQSREEGAEDLLEILEKLEELD